MQNFKQNKKQRVIATMHSCITLFCDSSLNDTECCPIHKKKLHTTE